MKEYTYTDIKTQRVVYKTVEANYVSRETVDKQCKDKTGLDPRLDKHIVQCSIRVVGEVESKQIGRFDKNKRMS